jgi:hypothetical protein
MAKFRGKVGYVDTVDDGTGIWLPVATERTYSGDIIRTGSKIQNSGGTNDNIVIDNRISILADPYAFKNFSLIRYVNWMGINWKVTSIDVQRPRLILTIGEVYNGNKTGAEQSS